MKRAMYLLVPLAFLLAAIAPGCYTVLKHPVDERGYQANQMSDCTRCHLDYSEYPYGYYYSPYPDYYWEYERYGFYYAYPWWWDFYDYPYMDGDYDDERGTKFDTRQAHRVPLPPPHAYDDYYMPTGGLVPPGGNYVPPGNSYDGTTGRPATGDDASRSKDEASGEAGDKETRQSNEGQRQAPQSDPQVTPTTTQPETPPADPPKQDQKETKKKKKTRRGGG